jgi:hypothetical protein
MPLPAVQETWGEEFILIGGMCNVQTLPRGSLRDIEDQARAAHAAAARGGVIIGTHSVDEDIPVESYDHYDGVLNSLFRDGSGAVVRKRT